ncbi:MAG: hypothetical protein ACI9VS_004037 [Candidatus Binatia bacterium]|jgi:hypothetical protein
MKKKIRWIFLFRRLHLYLGCFFTPMLLLYILTGWYQTVNVDRLKGAGEAQTILQKARLIHTESVIPAHVSQKEMDNYDISKGRPVISASKPATFKWLAIVMCIMATVTIVLGLILSFKTMKNKRLVAGILLAGCLLPYLMLKLGQGGLVKNPTAAQQAEANGETIGLAPTLEPALAPE